MGAGCLAQRIWTEGLHVDASAEWKLAKDIVRDRRGLSHLPLLRNDDSRAKGRPGASQAGIADDVAVDEHLLRSARGAGAGDDVDGIALRPGHVIRQEPDV